MYDEFLPKPPPLEITERVMLWLLINNEPVKKNINNKNFTGTIICFSKKIKCLNLKRDNTQFLMHL